MFRKNYLVVIGLLPNILVGVDVAVDGVCAIFGAAPPKIDAALVGEVALPPNEPNELDPNKAVGD